MRLFGLPDFVQVLLLLLQHKIVPLHMELQYRGKHILAPMVRVVCPSSSSSSFFCCRNPMLLRMYLLVSADHHRASCYEN
jgi:hypothetical protein